MKTYLTYGAGMTFASAVLTLILHLAGLWTDPERLGTALIIGGIAGLVITIVGIVLGTKAAREPISPTVGFSYGQAFKTGLLIVVAASVFGIIFNFIYFKFINPNFAETTAQWTQSFMERMGAPASQIEVKVEEIRRTSTVTKQIVNGLIGSLCIGGIISLITAAIMKRAPKEDLSAVPPVA